jgi:hypothetical protein
MLQAGRSQVQFPIKLLDFSTDLILPASKWPGVESASNRNEYLESFWGLKGSWLVHKAYNLTTICELID